MGIIYKIENVITHKIYIGQTSFTLEKRWYQHTKESREALDGVRQSFPLFHRMIIKYGEDNFIPSILEECENTLLDEREKYWIDYFDSYNNGYNRTFGGKTSTINHPHDVSEFSLTGEFIKHYNTVRDAAEERSVAASNIRHCCNQDFNSSGGSIWQWGDDIILHREIPSRTGRERAVQQFDKNDVLIKTYPSIATAAQETGINYACIYRTCSGKQKTAGKYKWKYI